MFIFAGFYRPERNENSSGSLFPAFAEGFRRGAVTFPLDGEQKTVGGGKSDPFRDLRNTQVGGFQKQGALHEPSHQLIMSDREIHFFAESLPERAPGNMEFGRKFRHRDMPVPVGGEVSGDPVQQRQFGVGEPQGLKRT